MRRAAAFWRRRKRRRQLNHTILLLQFHTPITPIRSGLRWFVRKMQVELWGKKTKTKNKHQRCYIFLSSRCSKILHSSFSSNSTSSTQCVDPHHTFARLSWVLLTDSDTSVAAGPSRIFPGRRTWSTGRWGTRPCSSISSQKAPTLWSRTTPSPSCGRSSTRTTAWTTPCPARKKASRRSAHQSPADKRVSF